MNKDTLILVKALEDAIIKNDSNIQLEKKSKEVDTSKDLIKTASAFSGLYHILKRRG